MSQHSPLTCELAADFDFSSEEYLLLFSRSNASAFQAPYWMQKLQVYACNAKQGKSVTLLIRETISGRLVLVLPLLLHRKGPLHILEFLNMGFVDYANAIYDPDHLAALVGYSKTIARDIEDILPSYDLLWIKHIRISDQILGFLFPLAKKMEAGFDSHRTNLEGVFEDWSRQVLSKKRRGNLRRARQKLKEYGNLSAQHLTDPAEIEKAFEALREFRHLRFSTEQKKERLQEQRAYDFYLNLAQEGAQDGSARTYSLTLDGICVAVSFGLCHGGEFIYLLPGADFKTYGRYSPGAILLEDIIRDLMADNIRAFDFSIGDEGYKMQFGTYPVAIHTLAQPANLLGRVALAAIQILKGYQARGGLISNKSGPIFVRKFRGLLHAMLSGLMGPEKR